MRVWISVDMEGVSGLVRWPDVVRAGMDYERNRMLMTLDANAAVAGAFEGGASQVVVEENHGVEDLCDLVIDAVDRRCTVVRGAGRPTATTMAALTSDVGVALLVGHHARAGSFPGIMAHTVSYTGFSAVRVGGRDCGEPEIMAIRAGELGVPIGLVTGDQVVVEQLCGRVPGAETAVVKRALSQVAGEVIPPERAREEIRSAARAAVARALEGALEPYRGESAPYEIEVELREPPGEGLRANLAMLPEFELAPPRTVVTVAPDMDVGFRRIAYLGYGDKEGLTRY
jgi:D-amino peptidase